MLYDIIVKPFVSRSSPEAASRKALRYFRFVNSIPGGNFIYRRIHGNRPAGMERRVCGIDFYNPVGLGAGLDLKGEIYNDLNGLGFSYVEIGPLNADYTRIAVQNIQNNPPSDVLGACIAADFPVCFSLAYDFCDFFSVEIAEISRLAEIIDPLLDIRLTYDEYKPIFVRLPENLAHNELETSLEYCLLNNIDGICTRSYNQTKEAAAIAQSRLTIIANTQINNELEAQELIDAGASLIELSSGLVHKGPSFVRKVIQYLENKASESKK